MKLSMLAASAAVMMLVAAPVLAQTPETAAAPPPVTAGQAKVPEGMDFPMRIEDPLSSNKSTTGDRFTITLTEDVRLPDGTVLKAGYRGVGEVMDAQKNGMLGKSGKLNVRLTYLKVGDERIPLRATKGAEGKGNTGNMVAGVIFLGVFAAFIKGHSVDIPRGTMVTGYADRDVMLPKPVAAPPVA